MTTAVSKQTTPEKADELKRVNHHRPYYEVINHGHAYDVNVFLPGVPQDKASITLEKNMLIVEASRPEHWAENWQATHREISIGDYRLQLELNTPVDESKVTATAKDGILTIHLPVTEEAKPRQISIQ